MQAIEIQAQVGEDHAIHVPLPDDWVTDKVKVIILRQDDLPEPSKKERQFGQFRGKIHMSDDFDDELPDSFWLGEE